jgi:hypothetical protein
MTVQLNTRREKIINFYHDQDLGLYAEWNFFAKSMGRGQQMEWEGQ